MGSDKSEAVACRVQQHNTTVQWANETKRQEHVQVVVTANSGSAKLRSIGIMKTKSPCPLYLSE
jgi:cell division inhibitor SulA